MPGCQLNHSLWLIRGKEQHSLHAVSLLNIVKFHFLFAFTFNILFFRVSMSQKELIMEAVALRNLAGLQAIVDCELI